MMQHVGQHFPEKRKADVEATIQRLTEEISTTAEELHELEVQLIRESLQS
jgi:hypothetical protein